MITITLQIKESKEGMGQILEVDHSESYTELEKIQGRMFYHVLKSIIKSGLEEIGGTSIESYADENPEYDSTLSQVRKRMGI